MAYTVELLASPFLIPPVSMVEAQLVFELNEVFVNFPSANTGAMWDSRVTGPGNSSSDHLRVTMGKLIRISESQCPYL